jgi:hypothetical protein
MKHKLKRIHFIDSERTQSRSLLLMRPRGIWPRSANTDEARRET